MGNDAIVLGGRRFVQIGPSTLLHDTYFWRYRSEAGLDEITVQADEDAEAFARRLIAVCMKNPACFELLGTLIVPEGTSGEAWTPQLGHETAAHLGALMDQGDKDRVGSLINAMLVDFFVRGISSLLSSASSSSDAGDEAPVPTTMPSSTSLIPTGAGATSSAPSPATTTAGAAR